MTRDEQIRVVQWLVELKTSNQIQQLIADNFHKRISRKSIWRYSQSRKWKPLIGRLRKRFENAIAKIPIANKADRLRFYQKVVDEALKWSLRGFSKDGDPIYELKLGEVTRACQAAKDELEPRKVEHSGEIKFSPEEKEERIARLQSLIVGSRN